MQEAYHSVDEGGDEGGNLKKGDAGKGGRRDAGKGRRGDTGKGRRGDEGTRPPVPLVL